MKMIFNSEQFACVMRNSNDVHVFDYDLEKNFFTPYGLFLPMYACGNLFIRALRGEYKAKELLNTEISSVFLHVNHTGAVYYITASTLHKDISHYQVTGKGWATNGFRGKDKDNTTAYNHLLKGSKDIHTAIKRMDRIAYDGFVEPTIYNVSDVAARLKELGHTKPFFYTTFDGF